MDPVEVLRAGGSSVAGDIDELRKAIDDLRAEIKSLLATYNSNNVEVQQGLIGSERWQTAHEKLDEERWDSVKEKLAELKGMLESVPIKVQEDIRSLWRRVDKHGEAITLLKGAWLAVSIGFPALVALYEMYLRGKG